MTKNSAWHWLWQELERRLGTAAVAELREGMRRRSHHDYLRSERKKRQRYIAQLERMEQPLSDGLQAVLERHRRWLEEHPDEEGAGE